MLPASLYDILTFIVPPTVHRYGGLVSQNNVSDRTRIDAFLRKSKDLELWVIAATVADLALQRRRTFQSHLLQNVNA